MQRRSLPPRFDRLNGGPGADTLSVVESCGTAGTFDFCYDFLPKLIAHVNDHHGCAFACVNASPMTDCWR